MIILGISDSHEAHACIYKSGKIIAAAAEERFSRIKTDSGYPWNAIEEVISLANIDKKDIDLIVFAGENAGLFHTLMKPVALFTIDDWLYQNENYWKPKLLENKHLTSLDDFKLYEDKIIDIEKNPYFELVEKSKSNPNADFYKILNEIRKKTAINQIGIDETKVNFIRHEECHQYYGYYTQVDFKKNVLIFTIEGGGDDSSATLSVIENGLIKEKFKTNSSNLGRLYRYITLLLGMKPCQHEYKVMGLAPYGNEYHGKKSLEHFRNYDKVIGDQISDQGIFKDVYYSSREVLEGQRFDGIAWGLQAYLEETLLEWINNNIKKYKIRDVVMSGGVAQNIKAMQALMKSDLINSIWAGPISGDGSLAIGAVWSAATKLSNDKISGLESIYLGTKMRKEDIDSAITNIEEKYEVREKYSPKDVAKWINEGFIVARCEGNMEFGQRALGNRSILADPRYPETVEKINRKVKFRDFWMPFTPTICYEDCKKYLVNERNIYSPWMTMAFDLKEGLSKKLAAVVHPADKTCRPQMLKKEDNPDYYAIIKEFEKLSGHPVLLNTSFNLHGDAIVETPIQAIETFDNSEIDILLIGGRAIFRSINSFNK